LDIIAFAAGSLYISLKAWVSHNWIACLQEFVVFTGFKYN